MSNDQTPSATDENTVTAVIADDEQLLVEALARELQLAWPELQITATANNGPDAIASVYANTPDIVFLDIQMPGANGIEVAQTIAEDWDSQIEGHDPHLLPERPLIVFATAFDDYAIQAFESAAVDYLLKPVTKKRLEQTVERLKDRLKQRTASAGDELSLQIRQLIKAETQQAISSNDTPQLRVIKASTGDQIKIIPIEDVILFESADKYVSVFTEQGESLIREPLKKLLPQLDPSQFEQIHRGAIVNMNKVDSALRDETGKITLLLNGTDKKVVVSRVYRHLFQPM